MSARWIRTPQPVSSEHVAGYRKDRLLHRARSSGRQFNYFPSAISKILPAEMPGYDRESSDF